MTGQEIVLNNQEIQLMKKEIPLNYDPDTSTEATYYTKESIVPAEVKERYRFSEYLIDPNKYRWRNVIRIMAIVFRFIRNCRGGRVTSQEKLQVERH
eukprot:gene11554-12745_t